jgi:hypothetical protein
LTTSHLEHKDALLEQYQSSIVGINEAQARHMVSFRLVLPTVCGRVKEGATLNSKHNLPAAKSSKTVTLLMGCLESRGTYQQAWQI